MKRVFIAFAILSIGMYACNSSEEPQKEVVTTEEEAIEIKNAQGVMESEEPPQAEPITASSGNPTLDSMRMKYAKDSWEWKILDFLESDRVTEMFVLDKVPFEGEELPIEGSIQIENLCDIMTAFPYLELEVKAHTKEASGAIAKATKKAGSKARAIWVATKVNLKGIESKRISSTGAGDDNLLEEFAPDDDRQKRLVAVLKKADKPGF